MLILANFIQYSFGNPSQSNQKEIKLNESKLEKEKHVLEQDTLLYDPFVLFSSLRALDPFLLSRALDNFLPENPGLFTSSIQFSHSVMSDSL